MPMQVPARAEGASAAEGRAASGRCDSSEQTRVTWSAQLENIACMRSRCAAGAEGASAAEGRVAPPPKRSEIWSQPIVRLRVLFSPL
jgi:hypothetical protein